MSDNLRVLTAAVRTYDGVIHTMKRPNRHHHIVHALSAAAHPGGSLILARGEQGFLLSDGTFASREIAARVAIAAGQLLRETLIAAPKLYSEDLW